MDSENQRKTVTAENEKTFSNSSTRREKIPIYTTSVGWAGGRSSIFTFLSYFGVVLGASPFEQSILTSVRNLGSNLFQSIWGWLADLRGRKLVILIGLLTLTLTVTLTPFVSSPFELVLISIIMTSIGFSIIPAWNAFLGDYSSEKTRASFIGFINSLGTLSSLILILTLGLWMDTSPFPFPSEIGLYSESKSVFMIPFLSAGVIFGLTIISALFLREKYERKRKNPLKDEKSASWRTLIKDNPPFRRLLPINSIFKFCMSMAWPIFPFVTLAVAQSWFEVAVMWAVFNLPRGLGQSFGGILADKYNKKIVLMTSRFGYAVVPFGYALGLLTGNVWILILVNIPGGLAFGAEDTAVASYSLDCSTSETRARYYSILLTFEGLLAFSGSLFSGLAMEFLLNLSGITYESPDFKSILVVLLLFITALRIFGASLHRFIYENPLSFNLNN
ncbi:MAG: MFS transporter [Candidatus Hodarchaeales archaeon]|jgi:MFS family permease